MQMEALAGKTSKKANMQLYFVEVCFLICKTRKTSINDYLNIMFLCNTFSRFFIGAGDIQTHGVLRDKVYSILSCRYSKVLKTIDWTVLFIKICNYINTLWRRISRRRLSRYAPILDENLVNCRNIIT